MNEKQRLDEIAKNSIYAHGVDGLNVQYSGEIFMRHITREGILELGPAEGLMTDILYPKYKKDYTIVDGSELFISQIKERHPEIVSYVSLFEQFEPDRKYANILLGHVLEHVVDPVAILRLCKGWLEHDGVILAAVPNANSIHRHVGIEMGLIEKLDDFSEKDRRHGHRRVFFREDFADCFAKAGFRLIQFGGYYLKPLSNAQIENDWTNELMNSFMRLGEKFPEIAADMYIVAKHE